MDSQQIINLEKDYVLQTYGRPDFVLDTGAGVWLTDTSGRRYLDGGAGIAVNALGHGDPDVLAALQNAALRPWHVSNLYHTKPMALLARDLVESSFADKVFFANSGSEANEGALKFARKYARSALNRDDKTEIVAFSGSFHGRSMGALSVTATEKYRTPFAPLVDGVRFAPYNDIDAAQAAITDQTCAVIVEPVQGEGGVTPAHAEFLTALRQRCNQVNALLIFDEVQCGLGRTGTLWAYQQYNVTPDLMTVAKPLAAGLPIGVVLLSERVAAVMQPGDHGSTFGGGPLVTAVAGAVLNKINTPDFLNSVRQRSDYLAAGLQRLAAQTPSITAVRGKGMMWGLVTTVPALDVLTAARQEDLLILVAGPHVVRLLPPLIISRDDIDLLLTRLQAAFETVQSEANI